MSSNDRMGSFSEKAISITGKIFDTLVLGLLFLVCSIPIVTIGASATALYYAYDKVIRREEGYVVKAFFHSFKMNFKQATILWLVDGVLLTVLFLNIRYCFLSGTSNSRLFLMILYGILFVVVFMASVMMFAALARFGMNTAWFFKFGYLVSLRHMGTSLITIACLLSFAVIVYRYPILVFVLPAISIFAGNMLLSPVLKKYEPKEYQE